MPDPSAPGRDIAEFTTSTGITVNRPADSWSGPTLIVIDALTHRLGDHQLAARAATGEDPDPGLSLWVSDDAGPSGYEWGCVECHGDDPGGREFYRSAATAAAWMHGRETHSAATAVTR